MYTAPHRRDLSPREAIALQKQLAGDIVITDAFEEIATVAGVDVGF